MFNLLLKLLSHISKIFFAEKRTATVCTIIRGKVYKIIMLLNYVRFYDFFFVIFFERHLKKLFCNAAKQFVVKWLKNTQNTNKRYRHL